MPNLAVFSTSVEVFPEPNLICLLPFRLLHVRGGVSDGEPINTVLIGSSPRPWRCFWLDGCVRERRCVFSTSVEVFLETLELNTIRVSLLHVRGGVSRFSKASCANRVSSPRPWRCFCPRSPDPPRQKVFSTSVEVFLSKSRICHSAKRLLHVRGGVSG